MDFVPQFLNDLKNTSIPEYIAVVFGIVSVYFSRKENILVYPTGLINTILYVYLSFKGHLLGEASVNIYYTIVSIYGWWLWSKKDFANHNVLKITTSSKQQWIHQTLFFAVLYILIFLSLKYLKNEFAPGAIPWADALASASAFTAMWLMAKKKVESWIWWIITNIVSIPLYLTKSYAFTGIYYLILLAMAISGLILWMNKVKKDEKSSDYRP
ncbi:MAG: nicotinamide mononucleotide transporter [Bacteroidetes bacterium]|nr:nicotinamide mononucleotide transporter [Bacteroidota bacterium]